MDVLLSVSQKHAYFQGQEPKELKALGHRPWFWTVPKLGQDARSVRQRVARAVEEAQAVGAGAARDEKPPLWHVDEVGPIDEVTSFVDFERKRAAFPVYAKESFRVPTISDELFLRHDVFTAEHDVPYQQRACADLAARDEGWVFDTGGKPTKLKVLVYDIETTEFGSGRREIPIDMIGWSAFDVEYEASKDLDGEEFAFEMTQAPPAWSEPEVRQSVAHNRDEEIDHLLKFVRRAAQHDIISGHNILSFDNLKVHDRIQKFLDEGEQDGNLGPRERNGFQDFLARWSERTRNFTFGNAQDVAHLHPASLDTLAAARKFYFFLDDFTLKGLAPFLGVKIPDRIVLSPQELKLDDPKTATYNEQDVREQLGVTSTLLTQALPLAFTVGWTFEELLSAGNVRMWDHMAAIRCAREKKLLPATCRARSVATTILRRVGPGATKEAIVVDASRIEDGGSSQFQKEFLRVAKYGDEMPSWTETPEAVVNPKSLGGANGDASKADPNEEAIAYAIAGGMTIHPQKVGSHFVPWWHVIAADVGAMYPTILQAKNLGADTVRLARQDEEPDDWVFLYRLPESFVNDARFHTRPPGEEDSFVADAEGGVFVGVKIRQEVGAVPRAMSGLMRIATRIKKELGALEADDADKALLQRKKNQYASIKAARNAGTHGIMTAVGVSCRQFNFWAGANITTLGQRILHESLELLNKRGARVAYADTDGLFIGTSRSGKNIMEVCEALGVEFDPKQESWIIAPKDALSAIQECNAMWRKRLDYEDFELEAEQHAAMFFVVHKNYLIFDVKNGELRMTTKGNNFRGSDKAPVAQQLLAQIMSRALVEVVEWQDEEQAREAMKAAIKRATREVLSSFDASKVALEDLVLRQVVKPAAQYKGNPDGSASIWQKRTAAIEKLIGEPLRGPKKFKFVVTKQPLPGIQNPSKTGIKPLDYMYPLDNLKQLSDIDLDWYRDMMEKYIRGAFGFDDLELHTQQGLDAWM